MEKIVQSLILVSFIASSIVRIHGQLDSLGFTSIDCGIPENASYTDASTGIRYVSDAEFTDAGLNHSISPAHFSPAMADRYKNVRCFPTGLRNCYTLRGLTAGGKYLVRGAFCYGNYDGLDKLPAFDLHVGANYWSTVNVTGASTMYVVEVIGVSPADYMQVCLVNTGNGTPFISGLDVRPLGGSLYPEATLSRSLVLLNFFRESVGFGFNRYHFWPADRPIFRYPYDPYDRIWQRYESVTPWTNISISGAVQTSPAAAAFDVPSVVMQAAATPANGARMDLSWGSDPSMKTTTSSNTSYFLVLYFAELERVPDKSLRQFDIVVDGNAMDADGAQHYTPKYRLAEAVSGVVRGAGRHNVSLIATPNATLPPALNAVEIFLVQPLTELATDVQDAKAMIAIRAAFQVKRNWMGDPCAPIAFAWEGLNCSYSTLSPPQIKALNLSSAGLAGAIDTSLGYLKSLHYLDLSHNSLSGPVPDFLAEMPLLQFLDLSSNNLSGSIPPGLLQKSQNGSLTLRIDNNAHLCSNGMTCEQGGKGRRNTSTLVIAIVVPIMAATLLFIAAIFLLHRMRKRRATPIAYNSRLDSPQDGSNLIDNRKFTYKELKLITGNFKQEIGQGGFGAVFMGYLENGIPIAVKLRSQASSQGDKEFLAEARHLTRVHHRNLVSLLGYCKDKNHLALVYEYMHGGNLEDRLRGEASIARPLSWHQRLKIALDSAHGLEYLHKSCQPPLIHRDVKSRNILLAANLEAKLSDFGLTKAFDDERKTHITTRPAGTLGYLDPEHYNTSRLSEKSDVYSFGVVLLELITGQPPAVAAGESETIHIAQWVRQRLSEGNIESIVDRRMEGEYDINSIWKVAELALRCKEQPSRQRPAMTDVVAELRESLELEESHGVSHSSMTNSANFVSTAGDGFQSELAPARGPKLQNVLEIVQNVEASETICPAPR